MVNDFRDVENYELTDEQKDMFWVIYLSQETYKDLSSLMSALLRHELHRRNLR
jgi:hypothetical protein